MPLALQAILPLLVLLVAAVIVGGQPRRVGTGWIACGATALAALIALVELLRLAPGEHVDVPYLTTFPYADLGIRLDGLSLGFATVTLITAALLMLVRQQDRTDRRDPWLGWLLTTAAVCALILAANLLLLYLLLQVVTLAWTGALDERAPRRRRLRLTMQIADIGLLLAAASAIQSVGTSSFSGVPSDTFGVASFWLMLLPVMVRIAALAWAGVTPMAAVVFEPAIAWLVPAAYILLRLMALMGGRLPDRPTAVILFALAAGASVMFAAAAFGERRPGRVFPLLLAAQAALALALSSGSEPLLTIACSWLWLLLIPLAGLTSVRIPTGSPGEPLALIQLSMVPATIAFVGVWLGALTLNARGLIAGVIPLALAIIICALTVFARATRPARWQLDTTTLWGIGLLLISAFPIIAMDELVIPAASTVRLVPSGTLRSTLLGLTTSFGVYPALLVSLLALVAAGALGWLALRAQSGREPHPLQAPGIVRELGQTGGRIGGLLAQARLPLPAIQQPWLGWAVYVLWGCFGVVAMIAVIRP